MVYTGAEIAARCTRASQRAHSMLRSSRYMHACLRTSCSRRCMLVRSLQSGRGHLVYSCRSLLRILMSFIAILRVLMSFIAILRILMSFIAILRLLQYYISITSIAPAQSLNHALNPPLTRTSSTAERCTLRSSTARVNTRHNLDRQSQRPITAHLIQILYSAASKTCRENLLAACNGGLQRLHGVSALTH